MVGTYGYTYSEYTYDEVTQQPISLTGPFRNQWYFKDPDTFEREHPEYYEKYMDKDMLLEKPSNDNSEEFDEYEPLF